MECPFRSSTNGGTRGLGLGRIVLCKRMSSSKYHPPPIDQIRILGMCLAAGSTRMACIVPSELFECREVVQDLVGLRSWSKEAAHEFTARFGRTN